MYLGIEFGSTRIKAVAVSDDFKSTFSGDYTWQSRFENGFWTYDLNEAIVGLKTALGGIKDREKIKKVGISGMMHGYLAFDKDWNLLTPFRTWQNTTTGEAASRLTNTFKFNIPQRWSIAHLYQAVLNNEEHIERIAHITTLAGYIHYLLTGVNAVGVGEASGIFPINTQTLSYDEKMIEKFNSLKKIEKMPWNVLDLLPQVLNAGDNGGTLCDSGYELIDHLLPKNVGFAPAEGDASTGMTATNAVSPKSGNISAGTSIFAMIVLEKYLENVYEEIDMVTTPTGKAVAMVHCNNCTSDFNAWASIFNEVACLFGASPKTDELFRKLYEKSLEGDTDCGDVLVCNYLSGESITNIESGRPLVLRKPESKFTLGNFLKSSLYSSIATLKLGMEILSNENVEISVLNGHGGLFKTPLVGQKYMAAACNSPITVMETAGEGGPYGMALLAAFCDKKEENETLEQFLANKVFSNAKYSTISPDIDDINGFNKYMDNYKKLLVVEQTATKVI